MLLYFFIQPSSPVAIRQQEIEISFETSMLSSPQKPDKSPSHPLPAISEQPVTNPTQPETEPPQVTPVGTESNNLATPNAAPPQEKIQSLSSLTRVPSPLKKIEASYPASERRAGIQAYVLAEIIIDAQGKIQDVRILTSAGKAFDATVIEALKNSAFTPGYIGDKAVPVRISIPFRFNLK